MGYVFLGISLALAFLCLRFAIRSLRSGRRTIGLATIGGLVVLFGLFVVLRPDPSGDGTRIERTIEAVATSSNPGYCDAIVTQRYLEQTTGVKSPFADELCERDAGASRAHSVDTGEITIEGAHAMATVENRGGSFDGSRLAVGLVKDGGNWKLNRIVTFRRFDRRGFDRAYRRSFLEFGSPVASADCALAKTRQLSDAEIEQATLRNLPRVFVPISVACDRDGVERSLVKSVAEPRYGLPTASIRCVADKLETLTDAALVRLELSPLAYSELTYRCGPKAFYGYLKRELGGKEGLDRLEVECVLNAFHGRSVPGAIRLIYDQTGFQAVIDRCR